MQELVQTEWEKINEIVCQINNIEDNTLMRRKFLQALNQLIYFDLADFCMSDATETKGIQLIDPVVESRYPKKFEEMFTAKYEKKFQQLDYTKWIFSNPESIVFIESEVINNEARMKSSYYLDYLKPMNLIHVAGMSLANEGTPLGVVALYRTDQRGDFTHKDMYILQQFLPHLKTKLANKHKAVARNKDQYEGMSVILMNQYNLSKREAEIVKLVCQGLNNEQIGDKLYITTNTVKKHMTNILAKLQVKNRVQLLNFLIRHDRGLFEE